MAVLVFPYSGSDSPVATQTAKTLVTVPATPAVGRRTLAVKSTLDVVLTVAWTFLDAFGNAYAVLTFTVPAGNVTPQEDFITSSGAITASGSAPTVTAGAYANLASHCSSGELIKYSATSPTVGSVQLDLTESEAF